jgi:kinesin family protein 6/9
MCMYTLEERKITFDVPVETAPGVINNSRDHFEFTFNQTFDTGTKQDAVFDAVARPIIDGALEGFNGTIFAYGQTGSGKTFTMTGGQSSFNDRGIIPRTLQYLFQSFKKRTDCSHQVHISYMEIYNEHGYDLLAEDLEGSHDVKKELPRVHLREDSDGNIHLRNLSAHPSGSEEEALNYLFVGDTNRHVSETTMNLESSRSHCIFTIFITASKIGSDTVRRSKIHLVDLAGSERVHKSQVGRRTTRIPTNTTLR